MYFCTKVKGIKKLHHLWFDSPSPGYIFMKERAGSTEVKRYILKVKSWSPKADQLPPILPPSSFSNQRQWYLYNKIREFCPENLKDITCPQPSAPLEASSPSHYLQHHHQVQPLHPLLLPPPLLPQLLPPPPQLPPPILTSLQPNDHGSVEHVGNRGIMLEHALINNCFTFFNFVVVIIVAVTSR